MRPHGQNWVPLCKRERIPLIWILAICTNQIMTSFIWTPIGVLTNPYCQKLRLNNVATTLVQLIGSVVGVIVPPFAAVMSDTCTLKFGRRRVFLIGAEIVVFAGLMMISFCREMAGQEYGGKAVAIFVIGQILASVGGNTANGPGRSMCSDLVPPSQQVLVSNICTLYGGLSGLLSNLIGALQLYKYTNGKFTNETFVLMLSCIIGFVALCISVIFSPEEQLQEKPATVNPFSLIGKAFKFIKKDVACVCLASGFFQLGVQMFSWQNSNYFGKIVFGGNAQAERGSPELQRYDDGISHAQTLALIQTCVQVFWSFINTSIINFIGLKKTWIFGIVCAIICDVLFFINMNKWIFIIAFICQGIAQVSTGSTPYAMISLVTPTEQLASMITVLIFTNNVAGILSQFILNMGLLSIKWFEDNPGRLIGISFVFEIFSIILGSIGFSVDGKQVQNEFAESSDESSHSSEDKPTAL